MTSTLARAASSPLSAGDVRALDLLTDGLAGLRAGGGRSLPQKLDVLRRVEAFRRTLATLDHALINDVTAGEVHSLCVVDVASLLVRELHVAPGEALARVKAAADLGPRRTSSGVVVAPVFGSVAAAQAAGVISVEHAAVIRRAVDDLPGAVESEHGERFIADLLQQAPGLHVGELSRTAARAAIALDPDAGLTDAEIEHRRGGSLVQRRDGMYALTCVLTPETGAAWRVALDSLAAPVPSVDGTPDPRTASQRIHDALSEIPLMLLRTQALPDCGGVVATLLVTMTAEQVESGQGYATTSHGDLVPVQRIVDLAVDSQVMSVLLDPHGGVLDYGRTRRLAPQGMRLALYARDQGCTFPDCDRPPQWTQAHHFDEWERDRGPTSVANMGLVCGYHHRSFASTGWRAAMINGIPHWVPPTHIDPNQTPRRNTRHHHAIRSG